MSADMGAERVPTEQQGMRRSIRQAVHLHGAWLKQATPAAVVATLVAAACVPVVAPLLGAGSAGAALTGIIGLLGSTGGGAEVALPLDLEEQAALARRLVTDRCLYGVDKNPMAVEMAKLSMWLVTLAKGCPSRSWTTRCGSATRCSASPASTSSPTSTPTRPAGGSSTSPSPGTSPRSSPPRSSGPPSCAAGSPPPGPGRP